MTRTKLTPLQENNALSSQANGGTAGGTMYYINLGGIKMLWCHSSSIATTTSGTFFGFTFPSSFFSTVQMVSATPNNPNATGSIYCEVDSYSATSAIVKVTPASNQNSSVDVFVIGT